MNRARWVALAVLAALACGAAWSLGTAPRTGGRAAVTSVARYRDPYDDLRPFMEGIYAADREGGGGPAPRVRAVIVPHHLTASASIAAGIRALKGSRFSRIVLLSPDHFHRCPTPLCTVDGEFETPFGAVRASPEDVASLAASPLVTVDAGLFAKEHGVAAVLPFIAHYLPGVPVTPVALSQRIPWKARRGDLEAAVARAVGDDVALVVSSDFSHYLPLADADAADERTAEALFSGDLDAVADLENPSQSDCPGCLWLLASLADERGFFEPSVLRHTNSARILGDERVRETTSHFAMAWYESASLDGRDLAAAGDVTVARGDAPPLSAPLLAWWSGDGVRVVNLEGPLAKACGAPKGPYDLCQPYERWSRLAGLATHWSVENNHMLDRGSAGKRETERLLVAAGETPLTSAGREDAGVRLFALTALVNPVPEAGAARLEATQQAVLEALARPRPDLLNVVFVHGGGEFRALETPEEERLWERFIDAGADAVLVAHGHVPGDVFMYKGRPIFRGLGNFVFDPQGPEASGYAKLVRLRKTDGRVLFQSLVGRR